MISIERLDEIVRSSLGPRWAAAGPFKTLALGGGDEDMIKQRDADQIAILRALSRPPEKHCRNSI